MNMLGNRDLRIAGVIEESIVDGPGVRFVLFLQGCHTHCPGCQNPQTWSFDDGEMVSAQEILERIQRNPLVHGVTFSGGEPFEQAEELIPLAEELRRRNYHLMAFSGYTFEALLEKKGCRALLSLLDLLVDGPFILAQKSLELRFRGSGNQRIIDVQASIAQGWVPVIDPLNAAAER